MAIAAPRCASAFFASSSSSPASFRRLGTSLLFYTRGRHSLSSPFAVPFLRARVRPFTVCASSKESENGAHAKGDFDFELITIGGGSGGVRASRFAANFGARVAVVELPFATISSDSAGGLGGTCVLRGCVPKKLLVYGSKFAHEFEESEGFGWRLEKPKHEWNTLIAQKNAELRRLTGVYKNILSKAGVTIFEGRGKIVDAHTVEINGKHYTTKHILVAVGGRAFVPNLPGKEFAITSDEALDLPARPTKIGIIGGGYIALEFASIFNGFGSEVHVYIRQKKVLRGFDEEVRDFVADQMALRGINFHFEENPLSIDKDSNGLLTLKTNKSIQQKFSHMMFATGRRPNTKNLGLEEAGVALNEKGAIIVNEYSRTNIESIWAVGDVTDRVNLTPVALMEGGAFARTVFGKEEVKADHKNVPSAVFTQPPIGTVGLTEEQAIEQYGDVDVFTANFRPMKATLSGVPDRAFMKIIVDIATDKVVGVHLCGEDMPEITQGVAIAVKAGVTKAQFDSTIGIHPTSAEELVTMRTPTRKIRREDAQVPEAEQVTTAS